MSIKIEDISKLTQDEKDYFFEQLVKLKADRYLLQKHIVDYALKDLAKNEKKSIHSCRQGFCFLNHFYNQTKIENAKIGDIITYHEINDFKSEYEKACAENCMHFGIIAKTDGTIAGTIIESKWGTTHVFKTNICDVVDIYGNAIVIWDI